MFVFGMYKSMTQGFERAVKAPTGNYADDVLVRAEKKLNQYANMTKEQRLKAKHSFEELINEHTKKLQDYIKNPYLHDNKNLLQNVSPEISTQRINGRIKSLKGQIKKQQGELNKILEAIEDLD